jgi:alpha-D-ribose 1-methylphosphonate 5-triphosphate diphosphatase PhnM
MHFDPRTQDALRAVGLDTAEIQEASNLVSEAVAEDAATLETFFAERDTVYSDMEMAHSADDVAEHRVEYLDLYTHGSDLRGYLRFDTWGVYVEGGRPLSESTVELTLGPTVHDRIRFADTPDEI